MVERNQVLSLLAVENDLSGVHDVAGLIRVNQLYDMHNIWHEISGSDRTSLYSPVDVFKVHNFLVKMSVLITVSYTHLTLPTKA